MGQQASQENFVAFAEWHQLPWKDLPAVNLGGIGASKIFNKELAALKGNLGMAAGNAVYITAGLGGVHVGEDLANGIGPSNDQYFTSRWKGNGYICFLNHQTAGDGRGQS